VRWLPHDTRRVLAENVPYPRCRKIQEKQQLWMCVNMPAAPFSPQEPLAVSLLLLFHSVPLSSLLFFQCCFQVRGVCQNVEYPLPSDRSESIVAFLALERCKAGNAMLRNIVGTTNPKCSPLNTQSVYASHPWSKGLQSTDVGAKFDGRKHAHTHTRTRGIQG